MTDFFDQDTGNEFDDAPVLTAPEDGASALINGSWQSLEVGADLLQTCKNLAIQAGFGKFRVFLNGEEVRPSTVRGRIVEAGQRLEVRPFDEAG